MCEVCNRLRLQSRGFNIADPSRTRSVGVETNAPPPASRSSRVDSQCRARCRRDPRFLDDGAVHGQRPEHLVDHEAMKRLPGRSFNRRADEGPAPVGVAMLRARLEQERIVDGSDTASSRLEQCPPGMASLLSPRMRWTPPTSPIDWRTVTGHCFWGSRGHTAGRARRDRAVHDGRRRAAAAAVSGFERAPRRKRVSGVTGVRLSTSAAAEAFYETSRRPGRRPPSSPAGRRDGECRAEPPIRHGSGTAGMPAVVDGSPRAFVTGRLARNQGVPAT